MVGICNWMCRCVTRRRRRGKPRLYVELFCQRTQGLLVRGAGDAAFGDDGGYVFCRSHVEGGVLDLDSVGHHLLAGDVRDLSGIALLDGNFAAVGRCEIDGRNRRGHVERNAVFFGQDGHRVGADLVGHVAVGGNAVSADDDGSDLALLHHRSRHVVGDDGRGNAVFHQFPGGQARALQEGTRLVGVDVNLLACSTAARITPSAVP